MAHLTNFSFEFFYEIFTEDASRLLLYHGAKKSKMTKNSNQGGGPALRLRKSANHKAQPQVHFARSDVYAEQQLVCVYESIAAEAGDVEGT